MKYALQTLASGGSGFGISYWKGWLGCQLKASRLEAARAANPIPALPKGPLLVGTITHAFLEMYYSLPEKKAMMLDTTAVLLQDDAGGDHRSAERLEAERLFRAYRATFPPDELGEVIGTEIPLSGSLIEDAVGIRPFTAKLDMVVRLTKRDCSRLLKTRGIVVEPGYWVVDHKTDAMRFETWRRAYEADIQFTAYMLAYQAAFKKHNVVGTLVNVIGKQAKPRFETLVLPWPGMAQQQVLRRALLLAKERRTQAIATAPAPNITLCFHPYPCTYVESCARV